MSSREKRRDGTDDALAWRYVTATDLEQDPLERLTNFPREPDLSVYSLRVAFQSALRTWLRVAHRFRVRGRRHLPELNRSFVVVANHVSHLDALTLLAALPFRWIHRASPAAARDYFFEDAPRILVAGIFINALPFDRLVHKRESLRMCRALLDRPGNVLILFPEGTRSRSGELGEFKPGIGYLTAGNETPVVPAYIHGAHEVLPPGASFPRLRRLGVSFSSPLSFPSEVRDREGARRVASRLRERVEALSRNSGGRR